MTREIGDIASWASGRSRPGRDFINAAHSNAAVDSSPVRVAKYRRVWPNIRAPEEYTWLKLAFFVSRYWLISSQCSRRLQPTPGLSCTSSMPMERSNEADPTPDSCNNFGDSNAPAQTITSRDARKTRR